jgi:hypothetical protein
MYRPKTLIPRSRRETAIELAALYVLTTVAIVQLLSMHWLVALFVAPFIIGGALLALIVLINLLWLTMIGIDRLGALLGIRKSPLS